MLEDKTKSIINLHIVIFIWGFTSILGRLISIDSFIIDDWKLYDNSQAYEMPDWEYNNLQDELGITTSADLILSEFLETHNCEVNLRHQGFLFVTPKF